MKSSLMKLNHVSTFLGKGHPEIEILEICLSIQDFNSIGNPQKDNFHNLILGIDKKVTFDTLILLRRISAKP